MTGLETIGIVLALALVAGGVYLIRSKSRDRTHEELGGASERGRHLERDRGKDKRAQDKLGEAVATGDDLRARLERRRSGVPKPRQ